MSWALALTHSIELLLEKNSFKLIFFAKMERFLVSINSRLLQVDPAVYCLNDVIYFNFELIDYETSIPLSKNDILGRTNNYSIMPVDGICYFNENEIKSDKRKICDIIFDNLSCFLDELIRQKFKTESACYLHNIFVISNSLDDVTSYFLQVAGADELSLTMKNLCTNSAFKYYSTEYLGIAILSTEEVRRQALTDCQLLEAVKMYFLVNQIVNFSTINDLEGTINNQMHIELLTRMSGTPIITLNAIDNMKQTDTFKRYGNMINFKISFLTLMQERRKNKNAILLNVLLYVLAYIGGIGTLEILQNEFGWPFKPMALVLSIVFISLGAYWVWRERIK